MNAAELAAFRYEIRNWNNIPLGSQNCRVNCIFCKINGDRLLRRFPPLPAITRDDLVDGFHYLDPDYRFARLGAGVIVAPHTDPYLHPSIYEFIELACHSLPRKTITTVTTGSFIDTSRLDQLWQLPNFGIDLSLITMQPVRESLVALATRDTLTTLLMEAPIRKISLMFTGDIDDLARDLDMLVSGHVDIRCEQILVRRIEHTRSSPRVLKDISNKSIAHYPQATQFIRTNFPGVEYTVPYLDGRFPREEYEKEAEERLEMVGEHLDYLGSRRSLLVVPESTASFFRTHMKSHPHARIHVARNQSYGGSVTVGGLLTNEDLALALASQDAAPEVLIVPKEMYDRDDDDLAGTARTGFESHHGVSVLPV